MCAVPQAGHGSHLPPPRLGLHHVLRGQHGCWGHPVMGPLERASISSCCCCKGREGAPQDCDGASADTQTHAPALKVSVGCDC